MREINRKKRMGFIIILIIVLAALLGFIRVLTADRDQIQVKDGILDLQGWNPASGSALNLNGRWLFYWEHFLQSAETEVREPDLMADTPNVWNSYTLKGEKLPGFGYASYRLKVVHAPIGEPLAIRIPTFSTAYECYLDGRLVAQNGKVGTDKSTSSPWYQPETVEFTPESKNFDLVFHVSNYTYARGGMWYTINLGTPDQIYRMNMMMVYKDVFLVGALAVMAFYYLIIFLLRREDRSSLFFVFMCALFIGRTLIYGSYLINLLIPFIGFRAIIIIDYSSLCLFPVCAAYMISVLFPEEVSGRILKCILIYAMIMVSIFLFTPISFFTGLIYITQVGAILTGAYAAFITGKALLRGKKDALPLLCGAIVVLLCAFHDMLYQNDVIISDIGELVSFGLFILLLTQSFVLSRRFAEAFHSVNDLSRKLLKLDKVKDEFLANTSHELRTPLSGILGIAEGMLKGSDGELNSGQKQNLSLIAVSSRRLTNLVNDILDYSRMKNGDINLNLKPIQLEGLIHTVVNVFKQLNSKKEYVISAELPSELPFVWADENRVIQILYNLVGNAVKYTAKGYVKVTARVITGKVEVCVSDTGEGIPEDKLEDIFKSFEQVDNSITRRHGGTGLGLPITKHLVELMGGRIEVDSKLGRGSQFYFSLPLADLQKDEAEEEITLQEPVVVYDTELAGTIEGTDGGSRILLVDDDAVNLQSAATILKLGGYSVTFANGGKTALTELDSHKDYALVILDVMMPEISGYDVCKRIRENKSVYELPVLMLTAKASTEDIVLGFEVGANDYLPKPYEPEELLARVRTLVNLKISVDKMMAAEAAFIQAQIKPHFLYNTLNAISSFCDSDPAKAQQLIDEFSAFLRLSFDFKSLETYVPLERELTLVRSYAQIEKARFGDKLNVIFDTDPMISTRIPILTIQPLVENAILHGLRKKGGIGSVQISVQKSPKGILVSVEDDGQGIPPEKFNALFQPDPEQGIGLWNIDRRLKKLFGIGLEVLSEPGKGTKVSFTIPSEVE